ncbi:Protein smg7 [Podila clonocystis]|nr:Protein smg7 [Podila clonocystis]
MPQRLNNPYNDILKDVYEVILLEDLVAAVEKSVDERLWRHVFYTPIEELRAELRKLERNPLRRQEVMDELSRLLDKGTGFYHEMITVLRCEHGVDISTVAVDLLLSNSVNAKGRSGDNQDRPQQKKSRSSGRQQSRSKDEPITPEYSKESLANYIQRCFVYLGDLARYRTNIRLEAQNTQAQGQDQAPVQRHSASNWQASCRFYERAITTFPDSGKPFGQMAILASYANNDLDALYWYNLRYQNRFRDLLSAISPGQDNSRDDQDMDTDSDEEDSKPTTQQDQALAKCGLDVLFIKIQMDLFAPHLQSGTFRDAKILNVFCRRISENLALGGFDATVQKMIASMIFTVWDLHSRTSTASFMAESTTKGDAMNLKQAQRTGLVYLLSTSAVLLEHQLSLLKPKPNSSTRKTRLRPSLMYSIEILIAFWLSHWDQVWGMIRLEEKWAGMSRRADLSLKKATVGFFRPFVDLLNTICQDEASGLPNQDDISQKALFLLQRDRNQYFGLLPFRRFHMQFTVCMDIVENQEDTQLNRFLFFASKVVQASEGIRGTVVEMSIEPVVSDDEDGMTCFRLMDAEDKRLLRERGSKMMASHWLQDQVSSLQKTVQDTTSRRAPRSRALVPLSTLPGTVKLPPASAFPSAPRETGQTLLSEYYRGASTSRNPGRRTDKAAVGRPKPGIPVIPQWTCLLDFSVLVWSLPDIKSLLDNRQCLLIVPLDVIDRLDVAKKGTDKENQKAREAIRFLDERMNRSRGHAEPLLIAQNVRDSLGRWNESIPYLVEEEEEEEKEEDHDSEADASKEISEHLDSDVQDVEMTDSQIAADEQAAGAINQKKEMDGDTTMKESDEVDEIKDEDDDDEDEIEVRNAMNVPRVWRPILGACLFLLRKREEPLRLKDDRFMLLTEDPDLTYYAGWFEIPASTVHGWKAVVSNA